MRLPVVLRFLGAPRLARSGAIVVAAGLLATLAAPVGAAPLAGSIARTATSAPAVAPAAVDGSASPSATPRVETSETTCDGYTVRVVTRPDAYDDQTPPPDPPASITVLAEDGTTVHAWTAPDIWSFAEVAFCRDLLGEGTSQLAYSLYSGGMHCCYTFVVLRLGNPVQELLRADLLDTPAVTPRQLDRDGALELVARDFRLEYLGGVPFVDTSPFPRIWAFRDGGYVDATRAFPAVLKADQKASLRELTRLRSQPGCTSDPYCLKGWALHFVAVSVLLGQPTSVISRLPLDLSLRRWMLRYRPVVARTLAP